MPRTTNLLPEPGSPELVLDAMPGSGLPLAEAAAAALPGELLDDILLGDVIDISELVAQLASPFDGDGMSSPSGSFDGPTAYSSDSANVSSAAGDAPMLAILYDDDILVSDGTIL